MREVEDSPYPPGAIIIAAPLQPRYWEFSGALEQLYVPKGTKRFLARSCDVAGNFNRGIASMAREHQWAWILGDDHVFQPDMLMRLLAHDVDAVVPINIVKVLPFRPLIYKGPYRSVPTTLPTWQLPNRYASPTMPLYEWPEIPQGLWKLPADDVTGQAGMLVKRGVLERVGYPWFKTGQLDPGRLQEDIFFCIELRRQGYDLHVDTEQVLEHQFYIRAGARRGPDGVYAPLIHSGNEMVLDLRGIQHGGIETPQPPGKQPLEWRQAE